jgi:multicomponent Na+:H+ antiporter subunit F
MTFALLCLAIILIATLLAGLTRVAQGPTVTDRMLAALLMGTTAVCVLLLVAYGLNRPALVDVALVFALLAAVTAVAFAEFGGEVDAGGDR